MSSGLFFRISCIVYSKICMFLGGDSHCPTHAAMLAPPPKPTYFLFVLNLLKENNVPTFILRIYNIKSIILLYKSMSICCEIQSYVAVHILGSLIFIFQM